MQPLRCSQRGPRLCNALPTSQLASVRCPSPALQGRGAAAAAAAADADGGVEGYAALIPATLPHWCEGRCCFLVTILAAVLSCLSTFIVSAALQRL